jgi:hypothetical protein
LEEKMRSVPKQVPSIRNQMQPATPSDGATVKNPTYRGKNKTPVASAVPENRPSIPVAVNKGAGKGKSFGPGGRFGRGGWRHNFGKTPAQEAETAAKKRQMEMKRTAAKTRLSAVKKGPNEKQSQLLGGE